MSVPDRTQHPASGGSPTGNLLLDGLPSAAREALAVAARVRKFDAEDELIAPGTPIQNLVFPTTVVCSVLIGLQSGQRAEIGTVGNEGFVGIPAVLGTKPTEYVVAQSAGEAYEISARRIKTLFDKHKDVHQAFLKCIGDAYHMAKQSTVCNAYHSIEQRLARWLLLMQDRSGRDQFELTHELLSQMVAATRPRVAEAAARLRSDGLIDYKRGRVTIRDRAGLQMRACECYEAIRRRVNRSMQARDG